MRTLIFVLGFWATGCGEESPATAEAVDGAAMLDGAPDAEGLPDAALLDAAPPGDAEVPDAIADGGLKPQPAWQPCGVLAGLPDERAECIELEVPLRRDLPEAGQISLFIKRVRPAEPDGRALWLLAGGPGQAGDALEGLAFQVAAAEPRVTVYIPDHRGTGSSSRLGCAGPEGPASAGAAVITDAEWPACHAEIAEEHGGAENLVGFSATEAARDLEWLIDFAGEPRPFVLGISYGTFLAWRYLQIAPDQAEGVMFDSACMPGVCHLSAQDLWEDEVGRAWFDEVCGSHPTCTEKLGPVPSEAVAALHTALGEGHCAIFGPDFQQARNILRSVLAQMLFFGFLRPALPAFVYRLQRCSVEDQQAIVYLFDNVFGGGGIASSYSWPLAMNILVSEMWEPENPGPDVLAARYDSTLMCRGVSAQVGPQAPAWSRYEEPLLAEPLSTAVPTLIVQAEYDPATPLKVAEPMTERLNGPHQRFVVVPHASHAVTQQSPLLEDTQQHCGFLLLQAFLNDPTGALPDCASATLPPRFEGRLNYNQAIFGTADLWEN